ncbi:hypothetical protein J6590_025393 [Homalodisca vitripennis]|nr:hypothetical protein J6590_025393 [Homalodisca vitripennis]
MARGNARKPPWADNGEANCLSTTDWLPNQPMTGSLSQCDSRWLVGGHVWASCLNNLNVVYAAQNLISTRSSCSLRWLKRSARYIVSRQ